MPPAAIALGAAGVAAAGSIAGGVEGANAQENAANQSAGLAQEAAQQFKDITVPSIQQQQIALKQIENAGNLSPQMEQTLQQAQSALNSYTQDPTNKTAMSQALQSLQQLGSQGGLNASDRAQINQIQQTVGNQEQSNRNAITQNFAQRGMAGAGAQLAAQLAGNQAAGQEAANAGFNVAGQAQQRALAAIQGAGSLGSQMESQNFGQAAQKAQAQNAITQFNTMNAQNVAGQNIQRGNYAQERNLNNQQMINGVNTGLTNQQEMYNKGLYQQQFGNQMTKAGGVSNALNHQQQAVTQQGQAQANAANAVGQGVGQLGTAVGSYMANQPKAASSSGGSEYTNDVDPNKYSFNP